LEKFVKICIVGATGHVGYVYKGLVGNNEDRVVGIAPGSDDEDVSTAIANCPGAKVFDDYRLMLDRVKPDIAAISPIYCDHAKCALEALRRGIHVFMEKPLATNESELATLKKTHAKSGMHLAAMLGIRCEPAFLAARKAVCDGKIGHPRLITAQKSYRLGCRRPFFRKRETYGGTIPWVGIHAVDWVRWLSGEEFRTVYATHSIRDNRDHGELELTALCHFTMTGEVFAGVNLDYLRPSGASSHGDDRVRVAGTGGVVEVRGGKAYLVSEDREGETELPLPPPRNIFAEFVAQVRGEGEGIVSAEDSFRATEAVLLARRSADSGEMVSFRE
jgi:predicted dehydrogenase